MALNVEANSWLPDASAFNISDLEGLKAKLVETGQETLESSAENLPKIAVPLLIGWALLYLADLVIANLVPARGQKNQKGAVEKQHEGVFYGNGPIPINDTLALVIGYLMLAVLVPIVGTVVGLTVLWDFIDRGFFFFFFFFFCLVFITFVTVYFFFPFYSSHHSFISWTRKAPRRSGDDFCSCVQQTH